MWVDINSSTELQISKASKTFFSQPLFKIKKKIPPRQMYKCGCKTTETWTKANKSTHPLLDGLDLEVQTDETEDETFQILDQVVEHTEALRVPARQIVFISKTHFQHWPSGCLGYSLTLTGWHQSGNRSWKLWKKCARLRWQSPVPVEISQKHTGPSYTSGFSC